MQRRNRDADRDRGFIGAALKGIAAAPRRADPRRHSTSRTTTFVSILRASKVAQVDRSVELPVNSTVSPMTWVQPLVVVEFPLKLMADVGV